MSYTQVYRSNAARTLGGLTVGVCLAGLATLGFRGDPDDLVRYAGPLLLVAWVAWAAYWCPKVTVDGRALTLHNVFRTVEIPWESVSELQSRYGLRVDTPFGSYGAWAVAAPVGRERLRGGDTEASLMARQRLERLRGLGELRADAVPATPRVTWNLVASVGFAVLFPAAVVGVLLAVWGPG